MNRFKSRKFWMAVGVILAAILAQFTDVQVEPETLGTIAAVAATYIIGQGIVDKSVVTAQVQGALDVGRAQLELYAKNLEVQLKDVTATLEIQKAAAQLTQLPVSAVPEE